ncbi:MAG: tRNA (adenosine(37)-N6)-threonylcarbamoyltransferase complex ATPase subunit type 1 TsaE [Alphaproteobacteria bacterium]|nr:MAG: tRNA (adenosine(37)-N6)-threonylcarbamoyltransferase complex ATPase subunit type 1 TsaE [Alphaproteobacteria bacterium]
MQYYLYDTQKLAAALAKNLKKSDIVCLEGEVGSGKSTFCNFLINELGFNYLGSPTFSKVHTYTNNKISVWHADLYEMKCKNLLDEYIYDNQQGILIIEWANLHPQLELLNNLWKVQIQIIDNETRNITITHNNQHFNKLT